MSEDFVTLLDWRRRVADLYSSVRAILPTDPPAAHALWRTERDTLFRSHPQSALPPDKRWRFPGLQYYDYDPRFARTYRLQQAVSLPRGTRIDVWSFDADASVEISYVGGASVPLTATAAPTR